MAYEKRLTRKNPGCFVFLLDQSDSMADNFGGANGTRKAEELAEGVNSVIRAMCMKGLKGDDIFYYFDVAVLGYGAGNVAPVLGGVLKGRTLVPNSELMQHPLRVEERNKNGHTVKVPVWVEAIWQGNTPMCKALTQAQTIVQDWIASHRDSFPPIVINVTDGQATDGDPQLAADQLKALHTNDGDVLLLNCHISSEGGASVGFVETAQGLPDEFAVKLFSMSSVVPPFLLDTARKAQFDVAPQARAFVYNASAVELLRFLEWGSEGPDGLR